MSSAAWIHIKEDLLGQASKQKITGLDSLEALLKRSNLGRSEVGELLDLGPSLLADSSSKVAQQALEALDAVVLRSDTPLTAAHASLLVPSVAERLGDSKQPVRAQALRLLVSLFKAAKAEVVLEKLVPLWQHKSWRVKHGLLEVLAEVVKTTGPSALGGRDQNNAVLKQVVRLMEDADMNVREATVGCLTEVYRQAPAAVVSSVQASSMRPGQQQELFMRIGMSSAAAEAAAPDAGVKRPSNAAAADSGSSGYHAASDVQTDAGRGGGGGKNGGVVAAYHDAPPSKAAEARRQSAATAGPAPPSSSGPLAKRGGFKDGGGVTADGELTVVAPVPVGSDRELRVELEAAIASLAQAPNADWTARMAAMQRVEGLVLGGALEWEAFHDLVKGLSQALSLQFKERRSSIARQACHLIGVLARAMGARFEPHALGLLPTLFGVLVITVAVMAESADVGVRELLRACQTGRVLQTVSDAVCKEKNPKTRHYALSYLVLILEDWDSGVWIRHVEAVEAAIRAAAQDSTGEARQAGRTAMALYHGAAPERANAFLRRLDGGLHEKLAGAVTGAKTAKPASAASRQSISAAIAAKLQLARQAAAGSEAILVMVPASSKPERRPEPSAASASAGDAASAPRARPAAPRPSGAFAAPAPHAAATVSTEASAESSRSSAGGAGRASRKSMGLPPGRIPGGSVDLGSLLGESSSNSLHDYGTQGRAAALRRPRVSALPYDLPQRVPAAAAGPPATPAVRQPVENGAATRVPCAQTPEAHLSRPPLVPAAPATTSSARSSGTWQDRSGSSGGGFDGGPAGAYGGSGLVPLSRVVTAIVGGPRSWSEKMEALAALAAHVRASAPGASAAAGPLPLLAAEPDKVAAALERVRERLLEALDDPHHKVLGCVLPLLGDVVRHYGRLLEGQLDRLLPALFSKGAENKEQQRALCADVLSECGQAYRADVLLPPLSKCLDLVKVPRGRLAVLEFFKAHAGQWAAANATQVKHWLVRLAPLLDDRAPDLRKRAAEVLELILAAPWGREPVHYVAYQHNGADVAPLRRHLLALTGPQPTLSASGSLGGAFGFPGGPPHQPPMSVTGGPPAATADSRRQLPSAILAAPMPLPAAAPSPAATPGAEPPVAYAAGGGATDPGDAGPRPHSAGASGIPGRPRGSSALPQAPHPMPPPGIAWPAVDAQQQPQQRLSPYVPQPQGGVAGAPGARSCTPAYAPAPPPGSIPGPGPGPSRALPASSPGNFTSSAGSTGGAAPALPFSLARPRSATGSPAQPPSPAPADATSQLLYLGQLMERARAAVGAQGSGPDEQSAAMEALADGVERCGREAWARTFPLLMVDISSCWAHHPLRPVRAMAFALLKELLAHQQHLFTPTNLEAQVNLLLAGCGDASREVSMTAGQALRALLASCSEPQGMLLLQQVMPREREAHRRCKDRGERLVAVMDGIRQLAARLERPELHRLTFQPHPESGTTMLEGLVANLADTETPVRRGAVVTLAELWRRLGHGVRDVLQVLAGSSFHLLCVYYLKLHGVTAVASEANPTEHPLVTGSAPRVLPPGL